MQAQCTTTLCGISPRLTWCKRPKRDTWDLPGAGNVMVPPRNVVEQLHNCNCVQAAECVRARAAQRSACQCLLAVHWALHKPACQAVPLSGQSIQATLRESEGWHRGALDRQRPLPLRGESGDCMAACTCSHVPSTWMAIHPMRMHYIPRSVSAPTAAVHAARHQAHCLFTAPAVSDRRAAVHPIGPAPSPCQPVLVPPPPARPQPRELSVSSPSPRRIIVAAAATPAARERLIKALWVRVAEVEHADAARPCALVLRVVHPIAQVHGCAQAEPHPPPHVRRPAQAADEVQAAQHPQGRQPGRQGAAEQLRRGAQRGSRRVGGLEARAQAGVGRKHGPQLQARGATPSCTCGTNRTGSMWKDAVATAQQPRKVRGAAMCVSSVYVTLAPTEHTATAARRVRMGASGVLAPSARTW